MSMKPCKECGHSVSDNATTCPNCGRARPGGGVPGAVTFVTVGVLVLLVIYLIMILTG